MSNNLQELENLSLPSKTDQVKHEQLSKKRQQISGQIVFTTGLGLTSGLTGFLVGTSSAPVLGAMFTGIFGLAATVAGISAKTRASQESEQASTKPSIALPLWQLGLLMIVLATTFSAGLVGGVFAKVNNWQDQFLARPSEPFPWSRSSVQPTSVDHALDWLCLQAKLTRLGYLPEHVQNLYEQQAQVYAQDWQYYQGAMQANPNVSVDRPTFGPDQHANVMDYCLDASKSADVQTSLPNYYLID